MKKSYIQLHSLVVVFAFTAVLGHLISLPAIPIVCWRTAIATLIFFLLVRPKSSDVETTPYKLKSTLTGVILGVHWITFFAAVKLSNITICLTGLATMSLFASFTEAVQERRKPYLSEVILGLIIIPSIILIVGVEKGKIIGLLCAVLSALLAATFTVINKSLVRNGASPAGITQYEMLGAFITSAIAGVIFNRSAKSWVPIDHDWLWLLLLATVCTVFACQWNVKLLRQFSAFEAMLAINFEPIYGILLAAILFDEHKQMHPLFFVGALMIVIANFTPPLLSVFRKAKQS